MRTVAYVHTAEAPEEETRADRLEQINPYMSNPCHIELILTEGEEVVQKGPHVAEREVARLNSRQRGQRIRQAITSA